MVVKNGIEFEVGRNEKGEVLERKREQGVYRKSLKIENSRSRRKVRKKACRRMVVVIDVRIW